MRRGLRPGLRDEVHSYRGPRPVMAGPDGARPQEWRTPPLWGIADSAPYLHDGRAETLDEAIAAHGGESWKIRAAYRALPEDDRRDLLSFLESLRAPEEALAPEPARVEVRAPTMEDVRGA